jgi:hypothetical protein
LKQRMCQKPIERSWILSKTLEAQRRIKFRAFWQKIKVGSIWIWPKFGSERR